MILGESPNHQELEAGKPFVGNSGRELNKLLTDAGINRHECWISNVCKYFVPLTSSKDKTPFHIRAEQYGIDINEQLRDLQNEINAIKPNVILALGSSALWALSGKTNITNYRGSILHGMGCKFIPTYHPEHLLYNTTGRELKGYWNKQVMVCDFKRALIESQSSELDLPKRTLTVCKSSFQLDDFIKRYKNYDKPAVDIEAIDCIPSCIGIAFTPYEGISVPLWNVRGISNIHSSELINIWIMLSELLAKHEIVGQNFKYDQDKIKRLGFIIKKLTSDTMLKAFAINPELPKNLAFNTSIYTREPYYKDEGANFDITKQSIDDLYKYNARDACVTKEIDLAMDIDLDTLNLKDYYENFIMHLHGLYLEIESQGFHIDNEKKEALFQKYITWSENLQHELFSLVGDHVNVNSPKQVKILLFENLKCPIRSGTGEEELTSLLNLQSFTDSKKRRIVEIILEKRRVEKTISTYLMAMPDYDGKMKTTYFLCLETGRTSTGQLEPPIRPYFEYRDDENKKKRKALGTAFQTITKHGDIGQDIRSQYVPARGNIFIQADSAQAEARVVFRLANDEQALIDIDIKDYHAYTTSWFLGGTEEQYSKKILGYECPERFLGKAQPLDSKILTPIGWKLMKDIQIGDEICNSRFGISLVTGIFSQGIKEVYKIKLSDGSEVESCKEHLWPIQAIWERPREIYQIKELKDILNLKLKNSRGNPKYSLLMNNAMWFSYQEVPIDPYILGLLIGDGNFTSPHQCSLFSVDEEIIQELITKLGYEKLGSSDDKSIRISGIRPILNELGLGGKHSHEKFIPEIYKFNSLEIRLEILRGLLDTDGTIQEFGNGLEFSTSSNLLATDVINLVRSLGGVANQTNRIPKYTYKGEIKEGRKSNRIFINIRQLNPFKLSRKAERWERWNAKTKYNLARNIISLEKTREIECQCISVDSEDHCYITDDFIITHNTLRHAGHLGAGKRRAAVETNTQARKYKIPIAITEAVADRALKIFHMKQPRIRSVFHAGIIKCLEVDKRYLTAPRPYGIDSKTGGKRQFFERWGDELFRMAFSYIPQRTISDNTKASALRIRNKLKLIPIVESHDSLLYEIEERFINEIAPQIKEEFEKPIDFEFCSLPRNPLVIPCEIELGYNYQELNKFKIREVIIPTTPKVIESLSIPRNMTEEFLYQERKEESQLTNIIYRDWEIKQ
jgi:uracil-DNA glycosylase family 4